MHTSARPRPSFHGNPWPLRFLSPSFSLFTELGMVLRLSLRERFVPLQQLCLALPGTCSTML